MGFKHGLKTYNAYLFGIVICLHSGIKTGLSGRQFMVFQPLHFNGPVFFKAQLAACLQRIFLCIFCIVYYHFCQMFSGVFLFFILDD